MERPGSIASSIGPNWFSSVMGTGIVAVAAAQLPVRLPGLHVAALAFWVLSAALLVALTAAWAVFWARHPRRAAERAGQSAMVQYWGAPAMALTTVGAGAMLLGTELIGPSAAVISNWVLWWAGTALGLVTTCWIPYETITRPEISIDEAFGGLLMPVVPPMVSAAGGALLIPHLPAGQPRLTMLLGCYAMFGISVFASVIIITLLWSRMVTHQTVPLVLVPTTWIVLGPLGQSITAAGGLARVSSAVLPQPYPAGTSVFALIYGVPAWGFAMLWLVLAASVTIRAARRGMPFALTWWAFTFPVGTCVTGTISLSLRTQSVVLKDASVFLFALLVIAWLIVAVRTTARL